MDSRIKIARDKHKQGYNCAQAVFCTYCDLFGMNEEDGFRFSEGFGAGMGGLRETCGAVTAIFMLAGLKNSGGLDKIGKTKKETYSLVKKLAEEFENSEGSVICREILENNKIIKKTCTDRVEAASRIVENNLLN